jgi:hypothetical protein
MSSVILYFARFIIMLGSFPTIMSAMGSFSTIMSAMGSFSTYCQIFFFIPVWSCSFYKNHTSHLVSRPFGLRGSESSAP